MLIENFMCFLSPHFPFSGTKLIHNFSKCCRKTEKKRATQLRPKFF